MFLTLIENNIRNEPNINVGGWNEDIMRVSVSVGI